MEMLNRIELVGVTGNCSSTKILTKNCISHHFHVGTDYAYKSVITGENIRETTWHNVRIMSFADDPDAFTFRPGAHIHVVGRLIKEYDDTKREDRYPYVYIQAEKAEYLDDEKKEG